MTQQQWDALAASLKRAAEDIKANAPLPAPPPSTGSIVDLAKAIQADLPIVSAFLADHQGAATGIADLLAALDADGVPHAGELRLAILHAPGILAQAEHWLPIIIGALSAFGPAPVWNNPWPEYPR